MDVSRQALALLLTATALPAMADGLNPRLSANLQYDWISFDSPEPTPLRDTQAWRRQEFGLLMDLPGGYGLKAEYDTDAEAWTDVYVRGPAGPLRVTVGQFKTPFGMDFLSPARGQLFTESSVSGAFSIGRRLGVMGEWLKADRGIQVALYGSDIEGAGPDRGLTARGFRNFAADGESIWHAGVNLAIEEPQDASARIRLRPDMRSSDPAWLDSGALTGFDGLDRGGVEAAWQRGDWLVQGEWLYASYDLARSDRSMRGGYVQGSWVVAGAPRPYKDGIFGLPKAVDGLGQVELALRYSQIAVPVASGGEREQSGWSVGANLQYGPYLRLMLDRHEVERDFAAPDAALWTLRAAVAF